MAEESNNKELRQQAITALAEGRKEISAEVILVRQHLSPHRVLQRVVDRHAGALVILAVTVGMVPALLLFRPKRIPQSLIAVAANPPPKPVLGALLLGAVGLLAKSITPALIKSTVMPHVLEYMTRSRQQPVPHIDKQTT